MRQFQHQESQFDYIYKTQSKNEQKKTSNKNIYYLFSATTI